MWPDVLLLYTNRIPPLNRYHTKATINPKDSDIIGKVSEQISSRQATKQIAVYDTSAARSLILLMLLFRRFGNAC